ncbi:TonB-dependent receptor [Neptunicella marina]|uniref:TonB-dependent receptor n=1 Tax=Neptunicella marina TaxID=2125989 RepID=A0A8J6IT85_9ALTE|nr:TonB-dependent receptor [Neptunicella marina]MBC3765904.1 TonB-dependent receptor [Neptunicella marina]
MSKLRLALSLFMVINMTQAEEINWHGFIAQGLIQAKDSSFINKDGDISTELTEVGINASYQLSPELRLSGQAVYLNGGNRYPDGARLDYLFFDWSAITELDWQLNVHIGRYKNYHWLFSATRDVPHTRPSIILPQSIYFDAFRDIALGTDGIALKGSYNSQAGEFDFNWSYGSTDMPHQQTQYLFGEFATGQISNEYDHKASLYFRPLDTTFLAGINVIDSRFSYQQGANDAFMDGKASVQRVMLHLRYDSLNWSIMSELMQERVVYDQLLYPTFHSDTFSQGGYVQFNYHHNDAVQSFVRLDMVDLDKDNRSGSQREQLSGGLIPSYYGFMDDAVAGLHWQFATDWKLTMEYHKIKGRGRLAPVIIPDFANDTGKYWDMWAAQIMYWF